ncbi:MAG TPA: methyltransferase [Pedobacter sp.]|uniref:tRNA1(Val) (adenine(37)-N6)-methyltransferase n=1 Tax=Pedobacter sp. TaxID=1411316 RepID=UPI002BA14BA2|nr:methyltransferase [Pedobacter sp.]HMI01545.1 methyltransferase [Pedobacter sp.]
MGGVFRFKEFEVEQRDCAMKINTDGVLLAAIAQHSNPLHILDIGTGTGVIAMMMAQRFPGALVDAVEIDEPAAMRAQKNFIASPFACRLHAVHTSMEAYDTPKKYDLIISNPPFFVRDLKNPEGRKSMARHADESFFEALVQKAGTILSAEGLLWLILPVKQADFVVDKARTQNLTLLKEISICSDAGKPVIRKIICLGRGSTPLEQERFCIYEAEGVYTRAYKHLLKDFFLAF